MRAYQVDLKFADLIAGDALLAEFADARGNRVRNLIACNQGFDHGTGAIYPLARIGRKQHRLMLDRNLAHLFESEIVAVDVESLHSCEPLATSH